MICPENSLILICRRSKLYLLFLMCHYISGNSWLFLFFFLISNINGFYCPDFQCLINLDPCTPLLQWFNKLNTGRTLTVRDLVSWISFVNVTGETLGPKHAFLHGVFLVLLDGLSLGNFLYHGAQGLMLFFFNYLYTCC